MDEKAVISDDEKPRQQHRCCIYAWRCRDMPRLLTCRLAHPSVPAPDTPSTSKKWTCLKSSLQHVQPIGERCHGSHRTALSSLMHERTTVIGVPATLDSAVLDGWSVERISPSTARAGHVPSRALPWETDLMSPWWERWWCTTIDGRLMWRDWLLGLGGNEQEEAWLVKHFFCLYCCFMRDTISTAPTLRVKISKEQACFSTASSLFLQKQPSPTCCRAACQTQPAEGARQRTKFVVLWGGNSHNLRGGGFNAFVSSSRQVKYRVGSGHKLIGKVTTSYLPSSKRNIQSWSLNIKYACDTFKYAKLNGHLQR